jgi:hypothetical protein
MLSNLQKLLAKIWSPLPSELFLSGLIEWVQLCREFAFRAWMLGLQIFLNAG